MSFGPHWSSCAYSPCQYEGIGDGNKGRKKRGIEVTARLHLTILPLEESVANYDTNAKMNPPLRTETDRLAVIMKDSVTEPLML